MTNILKFFQNPNNILWIDIGIFIFILLLAGIVFILNSNYFHFIASITLIIIGILLIFWGNINDGLINLYNKGISSASFPTNVKKFLSFLKINLIFHKILFFATVFTLCWFFETIIYFAFFKKHLKIHSISKKRFFVNVFSKLFVFGLLLIGVLYLLTPIYIYTIKHRKEKSNSYFQKTFQKLKITKLTNRNNNPFLPIWEDLLYIKNLKIELINDQKFPNLKTRFEKINKFIKNNFGYFYQKKWLYEKIMPGYFMDKFIRDIKDYNSKSLNKNSVSGLQKTINKIIQNEFIFLSEN